MEAGYHQMSVAPVQPTLFIPPQTFEEPGHPLYERIGGMLTIRQMVDDLCFRAMEDSSLRNWVRHMAEDPAKLGAYKRMFIDFIAGLAGGPRFYSGDDLVSVHQGLGITSADFDRFFVYFIQSAYEAGIPAAARSELLAAFAMTKEEVVEHW